MKTKCNRTVDPQGRVSIPGYLRELTGINPGDSVTVEAYEGGIYIQPNGDRCCICGESAENLLTARIGITAHKFCVNCARAITTTLLNKQGGNV